MRLMVHWCRLGAVENIALGTQSLAIFQGKLPIVFHVQIPQRPYFEFSLIRLQNCFNYILWISQSCNFLNTHIEERKVSCLDLCFANIPASKTPQDHIGQLQHEYFSKK